MFDPTHLQAAVDNVQLGWAVAVPIVASIISGFLQNKGQTAQRKAAQAEADRRRQIALNQLNQQNLSSTGNFLFPGILPKVAPTTPMNLNQRGLTGNPVTPGPGGGMPGRATGGPVAANQPYVVGEKGPEVVVPSTAGTVMPNAGSMAPSAGAGPSVPGAGPSPNPGSPSPTPTTGPGSVGSAAPGAPSAAQGGATATSTPLPTAQYPGQLVMSHLMDYLQNPGQLSTSAYEREQEQVNQGLGFAQRNITGALAGGGIDPSSGIGATMSESAALNAMKLKNEANRDFTQMSETLRRQDINQATQSYLQFLSTIFGINNAKAGTATQAGSNIIPNFANPYEGYANAAGIAGQTLGNYFANRPATTAPAAASPPASGGSSPRMSSP